MAIAVTAQRLRDSLIESAGTVVFGMEDGTVSIFGLIFGVAATTTDTKTVLIAGASGAVAAAVSMMAGVYLDAETTQDKIAASRAIAANDKKYDSGSQAASLSSRLAKAGLTPQQSAALAAAVQHNRDARDGLVVALRGAPERSQKPWEQALWMLFADFLAAAVPILPFVFLAIPSARIISAVVTIALLAGLGVGRARIAHRGMFRTVIETVAIGIAAALAGIMIGVMIDRSFGV